MRLRRREPLLAVAEPGHEQAGPHGSLGEAALLDPGQGTRIAGVSPVDRNDRRGVFRLCWGDQAHRP